jgi:hypothetical protein
MNSGLCPKCGAQVEPNAVFCGSCGTPIPAEPAAGSQIQPGATPPQQPQVPTSFPQPPAGYSPQPGSYPQPGGVYPPPVPGGKTMGQNTKWAIGLGIAALFCCGPFTGVPGFIMAKKDMDAFASGQAPYLDESAAKLAYYLNIVALILFILGICLFWGRLGMLRRF